MENESPNTPIHLFLGSHTEDRVDDISSIYNTATASLRKDSRPVGIILEDSATHSASARLVQYIIDLGYTYSEAEAAQLSIEITPKGVTFNTSKDDISKKARELIEQQDPFTKAMIEMVDELCLAFRGRVVALKESVPSGRKLNEQIENEKKAGELFEKGKNLIILNNRVKKGAGFVRQAIDLMVKTCREREDRIIADIKREAGSGALSLIVGHLGTAHTRVGIELARDNFDITRVFPEKTDGKTFQIPLAVIIRKKIFDPTIQFSDEEILIFFMNHAIFELIVSVEDPESPSRQRMLESQYAVLRSRPLTDSFIADVYKKGFFEAFKYFQSRLTSD